MSFWEDIKRPFNLASFALAVVSLGVAYYFYVYPHNDRGIAYIASVPSKIYDSQSSGPTLKLIDAKNDVVTSDTYLQTFIIWNSGAAAIERSDVRRPIILMFDGAERILDYRILEASDSDVSCFELSRAKHDNIEIQNALELTWQHFDPKKAVKVQAIFAQSSKPRSYITGTILGVDKFTLGQTKRNWTEVSTGMVFTLNSIMGVYILRKDFRKNGKMNAPSMALGAIVLVCCLMLAYIMFTTNLINPTPPI